MEEVCALPEVYDETKYIAFIDTWGTVLFLYLFIILEGSLCLSRFLLEAELSFYNNYLKM